MPWKETTTMEQKMLNFIESGGIRESYFFNRLEALLNSQFLKFWLLSHYFNFK